MKSLRPQLKTPCCTPPEASRIGLIDVTAVTEVIEGDRDDRRLARTMKGRAGGGKGKTDETAH